MTVNEFIKHLNETYGLNSWPVFVAVDAETYGHVCNHILKHVVNLGDLPTLRYVSVGPHNGIMFKNIELLLKQRITND